MKKLLIAAIMTGFFVLSAAAQSTAFTYQGRLTDSGLPANGLYDFQFWLYDTLADGTGTQIATANVPAVQVTNGAFTATIDFGANAFPGADRFMQIVVRPNNAPPSVIPTILSPRQPLNSTPYAIRSTTATTADTAANAAQLGGTAANQFVLTNDARMSDARPPTQGSADYIQNGTSQQVSSNFNITGNGMIGGALTAGNTFVTGNMGLGVTPTSERLQVLGNGLFSGNISGNTIAAASQFNLGGTRILGVPGTKNLFVGVGTGGSNATGDSNSFFGFNSGAANVDGRSNSFFGNGAGQTNTAGSFNAYFGSGSGGSNTDGNNNAFFGFTSGRNNASGFNNSFFGNAAGLNTTNGGNNTFSGFFAGSNNTIGQQNTFFGGSTGPTNTTGGFNTLLGYGSDVASAALTNATAVGAQASVSQSNSLILGSINGVNAATADTNVGIGTTAPTSRLHVVGDGLFTGNLTVNGNINGNLSLSTINATTYNLNGSQIIGGNGDLFVGNFFSGFRSGQSLTNGTFNSFFGIEAGKVTDSGGRNSFFGYQAGLQNTGGHDNSYFGYNAGLRCTGSGNSFFGQGTGLGSGSPPPNDCTGSNNSFVGQNAGTSLTNGQNNAAVGQGAGSGLMSGSLNSFLGAGAGAGTIEGSTNTFIGQSSGGFNRTGTDNTALGSNAWVGGSPATNNLTNATAIGANSCVTASDSLVLGSITNNPNCFIPAGRDTKVGIGTSSPTARLHVVGDGLFTGNLTVNGTINGNISSGNFIQNSTTQQASSNFNISGNGVIAGNAVIGANSVQSQARLQIFDNNGSIQFGGTCNPGANAVGFASTFTCANYSLQGNGSDTMLNRAAGGNLFFREANTNEMTIVGGGNVGIGTTSPTTRLHVVGDGLFTGNLTVNGALNGSTQFNIGGNRVLSVSGSQNTNTFVGVQAGNANPTGDFNSFFGSGAGMSATTGTNNSFFGSGSGGQVTNGSDNSFFGQKAGVANTASQNSFFGSSAGSANVDGEWNSFFGYRAGASNIGQDPGLDGGQGAINSFFGAFAGENNTYGDNDAFFGYGAGRANTTGGLNTFVGVGAGVANTNGNVNTFVGVGAGGSISTGGGNTVVGGRAGGNFTSGDYNSFFGADIFMLSTSIVGNNVTLLGGRTRLGGTASNATAVGAFATVTQDNSLVLGGINGVNGCNAGNKCGDTNVGIGTTTPQDRLHVNGNVRVTNGGIYVANPNTLVITSPNGACWGITVNNAGALSTFPVTCPQ